VSVLRDGQLVMAQNPTSQTSVRELTEVITGTVSAESGLRISPDFADTQTTQNRKVEPALEAVGLSGARVSDVNFRLYPGEILAVTGLAGSGRSELGRLLFGSQPMTSGAVMFKGEDVSKQLSPNESMARGVGYIPQDRKQALVSSLNLTENLTLATIKDYLRGIGLSSKSTRAFAEGAIEEFDVRPADPERKIGELSGGNQQKIVLGKWLAIQPAVLILDEGTYGVDIGARQSIMKIVTDRVSGGGLGVLLIDSDIDLIASYADRVLIMQDGRFVGEIIGDDITPASIAAASYAVLETHPT
jgi:ribose transport system ATP-binding protein